MIESIYWITAIIGAVFIIIEGEIFLSTRQFITRIVSNVYLIGQYPIQCPWLIKEFVMAMITCPQCLGFQLGAWISFFHPIVLQGHWLLDGFVVSLICWIIDKMTSSKEQ